MESQLNQLADINYIVTAVVVAAFFTLLFLTGNTMMQSTRERTPELGVLKTLGFSDGGVGAIVLAEALILCLFGAAIGLTAAVLLFPVTIGNALNGLVGSGLSPLVVYAGIAVAVLLAIISGLPPAWRARRLNIIDALAGR